MRDWRAIRPQARSRLGAGSSLHLIPFVNRKAKRPVDRKWRLLTARKWHMYGGEFQMAQVLRSLRLFRAQVREWNQVGG